MSAVKICLLEKHNYKEAVYDIVKLTKTNHRGVFLTSFSFDKLHCVTQRILTTVAFERTELTVAMKSIRNQNQFCTLNAMNVFFIK